MKRKRKDTGARLPTSPPKDDKGNEIVGAMWNDNGALKIVGGGTADDDKEIEFDDDY